MILLKTPDFWSRKYSAISICLLPISVLYYIFYKIFKKSREYFKKKIKLKSKVICIGNITIGGSGKTPSCIFLSKMLKNAGYNVVFLTRGYGRSSKGFKEVLQIDNPNICGDEPILLSRYARTFVYSSLKDVQNINNIKCDFIIMDDGLQNSLIHKDFSILIRDFEYKSGNGLIFPSGPLRCKYKDVLYDMIFNLSYIQEPRIINESSIILKLQISGFEKYLHQNLNQDIHQNLHQKNNIFAFCGLARCDKFFKSLTNSGVILKNTISFPDHYKYTTKDIDLILKIFNPDNNDIIFTTQKDYVKINYLISNTAIHNSIKIVPIDLEIIELENISKIINLISTI